MLSYIADSWRTEDMLTIWIRWSHIASRACSSTVSPSILRPGCFPSMYRWMAAASVIQVPSSSLSVGVRPT
jgi:hypothetical protein